MKSRLNDKNFSPVQLATSLPQMKVYRKLAKLCREANDNLFVALLFYIFPQILIKINEMKLKPKGHGSIRLKHKEQSRASYTFHRIRTKTVISSIAPRTDTNMIHHATGFAFLFVVLIGGLTDTLTCNR